MNLCQSAKGTILPIYGLPTDDQALEILSRHLRLPVIPLSALAITRIGGVFNCLTVAL
jgi:agmatine/peptidylarginine deiminase